MMKRVIVNIDRLVLGGGHGMDRHALAAGLRAELERLFARPATTDALASLGHVARVDAGTVSVVPGAKPQRTGASVARAIARSVAR